MSSRRVAIVCDWLTGIGGAERVVLEMHRMYPDAPIFTSQYDKHALPWFKDADVRTGWLQNLPTVFKKFLPVLRIWHFSHLDLSDYDLILSSSGAEAKGVKKRAETTHISYVHAPTHYYWSRYDEYLKRPGFPTGFNWLARIGLRLLVGPLRRWDKLAASRPDAIVTNSNFSKAQIQKYYGRNSVVIHPPVDTRRFEPKQERSRSGFVIAGRQTPYKRIDLAVSACSQLGLPLIVIGNGPEHARLQHLAGPNVSFMTDVSDQEIVSYFQSARGFIFPGIDDFGIVAVEALSAGTPVIAYKDGGALDYVTNQNGIFFEEQSLASLVAALKLFQKRSFNHKVVSTSAKQFSPKNFTQKLREVIDK